MSKGTGLGDQLFVGGYDLSGDIGSVDSISGGPDPLEVTAANLAIETFLPADRESAVRLGELAALRAEVSLPSGRR